MSKYVTDLNRFRKEVSEKSCPPVIHNAKKPFMASAHPGFKSAASSIARRGGYSMKSARAILASSSRHASAKAKKKNPRLLRVRGMKNGGIVSAVGRRPYYGSQQSGKLGQPAIG